MIQYLSSPEEFLSECYRVLKKRGTLIISVPNRNAPGFIKTHASKMCFSVPELFVWLNQYCDTEIFGFSPTSGGVSEFMPKLRHIIRPLYAWFGRVISLMPKGRKVKEYNDRINPD